MKCSLSQKHVGSCPGGAVGPVGPLVKSLSTDTQGQRRAAPSYCWSWEAAPGQRSGQVGGCNSVPMAASSHPRAVWISFPSPGLSLYHLFTGWYPYPGFWGLYLRVLPQHTQTSHQAGLGHIPVIPLILTGAKENLHTWLTRKLQWSLMTYVSHGPVVGMRLWQRSSKENVSLRWGIYACKRLNSSQ